MYQFHQEARRPSYDGTIKTSTSSRDPLTCITEKKVAQLSHNCKLPNVIEIRKQVAPEPAIRLSKKDQALRACGQVLTAIEEVLSESFKAGSPIPTFKWVKGHQDKGEGGKKIISGSIIVKVYAPSPSVRPSFRLSGR